VTEERAAVLAAIGDALAALERPHPTRVAIDGPDAAGKTTLADELAAKLQPGAIRVSVDDFLRPRSERSRDAGSPEAYYHEAFDVELLLDAVLRPLRPGGDRRIRRLTYDYATDTRTELGWEDVSETAVVLSDGVFLQRPELREEWDAVVYVHVSQEETLRRARVRDAKFFGSAAEVESRYRQRYLPAQELYRAGADPRARADIVVDNEDPDHPRLLRCGL
jgi:uridine kinase